MSEQYAAEQHAVNRQTFDRYVTYFSPAEFIPVKGEG